MRYLVLLSSVFARQLKEVCVHLAALLEGVLISLQQHAGVSSKR